MIKINPLPPLEFLNECFELDSSYESGIKWKQRKRSDFKSDMAMKSWNSRFANKMAGCKIQDGYYILHLKYNSENYSFRSHRAVYSIGNKKELPLDIYVDHIDRNPSNNSLSNLRESTAFQNSSNMTSESNNKAKFRGITHDKRSGKWLSSIQIKGVKINLGYFKNLYEAIMVRKYAEEIRLTNFVLEDGFDYKMRILSPGDTPSNICRKCFTNKTAYSGRRFCLDCVPKNVTGNTQFKPWERKYLN